VDSTFNGKLSRAAVAHANPEPWHDFQGGAMVTLTNKASDFDRALGVLANCTLITAHLADAYQPSPVGAGYFMKIGNAGAKGTLFYTGGAVSTDRRLRIGGGNDGHYTGGAVLHNNGSGPITFTHPQFTINVEETLAVRDLELGGSFDKEANAIEGIIADNDTSAGGLINVIINGGTWRLEGDNTYTGTTTVIDGRLAINGGQSAANGDVTVFAGAALSGSGTVGGDTEISGTHAPGASTGVQTFSGNLTYSGGEAKIEWEPKEDASAQVGTPLVGGVVVGGNLDFDAETAFHIIADGEGSPVDWSDPFWNRSRKWLLYEVKGSLSGFNEVFVFEEDWKDGQGDALSSVHPRSTFKLRKQGRAIYLDYR
jgi:autotransporter-associated beta strand protein